MKKILSAILCAMTIMITGCSNVSQDEYNSLVEENEKLKSDCERIIAEKNALTKEIDNIKTNSEQEINALKEKHSKIEYCFDICTWMLGRPQSSIVSHETSKYSDNVDLETTYYMENSELTIKMVHSIKENLSPTLIAIHMAAYEKSLDEGIQNLMNDGITEFVVIYRYTSGDVIMSSYRYLDSSGLLITDHLFTAFVGNDFWKKFSEIYYK